MAQHKRYWSCSKLADVIRGTKKPPAATMEEWRDWKKDAKAAHPFRYWLADEALDWAQDLVTLPVRKLYDVKYHMVNRWVTRTHTLTADAEHLPRGRWAEFDQRVLYCLFDELQNFVEVELAWHHIAWDKEARQKFKTPFWAVGWFRSRTWRSPAAGLEYLDWASNLRMDESWGVDPTDPKYNQSTQQAIAAKETRELYDWWVHRRPARPDPYEASGWNLIMDEEHLLRNDVWAMRPEIKQLRSDKTRAALDKIHELELQYDTEDTEMLKRLIDIRKHLWT